MDLPLLEACPHELPANEFGTKSQFLSSLGKGDDWVAVMLTCWELGVAPDNVSQAKPGAIMINQNAGALVPRPGTEGDEVSLASIVYGVEMPTVRHLIVCGHTLCTTLALLVAEEKEAKENPFSQRMQVIRKRFAAVYGDRPRGDWLGIVVQESVLQQLANLRSHPLIGGRLREGSLQMHAWIRDDDKATIKAYDPKSGQFSG